MPFDNNNFSTIGGQSSRGAAPQAFSYISFVDTIAQIDVAGYFNGLRSMVDIDDILFIVGTDSTAIRSISLVPLSGGIEIAPTYSFVSLGTATTATNVTIQNSAGSNAVIALANTGQAGLQSDADRVKVAGIATGATANSTDAVLLDRANHTGTQLASTISDFSTSVSGNAAVSANTAKVSNATHTGDVTGATTLTIASGAVSNAKLAQMGAFTVKGNNTGAIGPALNLSVAQLRGMLGLATTAVHSQSFENLGTSPVGFTATLSSDSTVVKISAPNTDTCSFTICGAVDVGVAFVHTILGMASGTFTGGPNANTFDISIIGYSGIAVYRLTFNPGFGTASLATVSGTATGTTIVSYETKIV